MGYRCETSIDTLLRSKSAAYLGYVNDYCIQDQNLWLATSSGLWKLDEIDAAFERIDFVGMESPRLLSIAGDVQGRLYLGTESNGLVVFDRGVGRCSAMVFQRGYRTIRFPEYFSMMRVISGSALSTGSVYWTRQKGIGQTVRGRWAKE